MQYVITKTSIDGIGNVMKGLISALSINNNSVIECNPEFLYGKYNTALSAKHIYVPNSEPYEPFYTWRFLLLKDETKGQKNITTEHCCIVGCGNTKINSYYDLTTFIDGNYDIEAIKPEIRIRICNIIKSIEFLPIITQKVESLLTQFNIGGVLGVSVRTWQASHEKNVKREYSESIYKTTIENHIKNENIKTVLLCADRLDVLEEYESFMRKFPVKTIALRKQPELNMTQYAFIQMLALSKCDYLIVSRRSTFTELAWWFGLCHAKVIPLF